MQARICASVPSSCGPNTTSGASRYAAGCSSNSTAAISERKTSARAASRNPTQAGCPRNTPSRATSPARAARASGSNPAKAANSRARAS